jgi:hypothetical protein
MSDSNSEIDQLITELVATRKEIDREIERLSTHWGIFGPFQISIVKPEAIALIYGIFLAASFVLGIVFSLHKGTLANLGIALIVGTLFAGGAVVGQIWGFAIQEKGHLFEQAFGDERTEHLENLGKKFWKLQKRIDHLQGELPSGRDGVQQPRRP